MIELNSLPPMKNGKMRIELRHLGLKQSRTIAGFSTKEIEVKGQDIIDKWDDRYSKSIEKEQTAMDKKEKEELALNKTKDAEERINAIKSLLLNNLRKEEVFTWGDLKLPLKFRKPKPKKPEQPPPPQLLSIPLEPDANAFRPEFDFLDNLSSSRKEEKIAAATDAYYKAYYRWAQERDSVYAENNRRGKEYEGLINDMKKDHDEELEKWNREKDDFLKKNKIHNDRIEQRKAEYHNDNPEAIHDFITFMLNASEYPEWMKKEVKIEYNTTNKVLVIDFRLPFIDDLPTLKEIRYVKSKDEFKYIYLSEREIDQLYDSLIYQIALRVLYDIYNSDEIAAIDSVVFNGRVNSIDLSTGHEVSTCIVTLQANRDEFLNINLFNVEPKACFKKLKGVGSSKLHSITPVAPIIDISREDKRFVDARNVADGLDDSYNLAAMDWEDFEHLVRQVFEKEFSSAGGEVKITRSSRDAGVDAIAFDPDPIRGGKIVIQAKRYTNVVGVSAVRDLYGTLMNEGATKGILVTTSDYGPDAYEFARGKPLTLLNGGNLLHLLEKHGHKAKIDLQEAKKLIAQNENE